MRFSLNIGEYKLYRLASVLLYGWVAVEQQGQFALLKGFALDRFISLAGDRVTQVVVYGRNAPDIVWRWLAFDGHS
jgi:hypothetical protein